MVINKRPRGASSASGPLPHITKEEMAFLQQRFTPNHPRLEEAARLLFNVMCRFDKYLEYRTRLQPDSGAGDHDNEDVWTDEVEIAFLKAVLAWPPVGRCKIQTNGGAKGRNEIIASAVSDSIRSSLGHGDGITRKQVSSHLQVLKGKIGEENFVSQLLFSKTKEAIPNDQSLTTGSYPGVCYTMNPSPNLGQQMTPSHSTYSPFLSNSHPSLPNPALSSTAPASGPSPSYSPGLSKPPLTPSAFGMHLSPRMYPKDVSHTFTTLAPTSQAPDMSLSTFRSTKGARFPTLFPALECNLNVPIILMSASLNLEMHPGIANTDCDLRVALESRPSDKQTADFLSNAREIVARTVFYDNGCSIPGSPEPLSYGSLDKRLVGFRFGSEYWSTLLSSLTQQPELAQARLSNLSATQEIWCTSNTDSNSKLLLIICWEFRSSTKARTTWKSIVESPAISKEDLFNARSFSSLEVQPLPEMLPLAPFPTDGLLNAGSVPMSSDLDLFNTPLSMPPFSTALSSPDYFLALSSMDSLATVGPALSQAAVPPVITPSTLNLTESNVFAHQMMTSSDAAVIDSILGIPIFTEAAGTAGPVSGSKSKKPSRAGSRAGSQTGLRTRSQAGSVMGPGVSVMLAPNSGFGSSHLSELDEYNVLSLPGLEYSDSMFSSQAPSPHLPTPELRLGAMNLAFETFSI